MKSPVRVPIRLKIMISMLFAITAVVSVITFLMANLFHEDKSAYVNDWVTIAAVSTADESRSLLEGYKQRLQLFSRIMLNSGIEPDEKTRLLQSFFDDLPELIEIVLYRDGEEVRSANDVEAMQQAGISSEQIQQYRDDNPLPMQSILEGQIYVRNSTLSPALPCLTLAFVDPAAGQTPTVISAIIGLDELLRLGSKFEVFEVLLVAQDGTLLAHPDVDRVARRQVALLTPEATSVNDDNRAGLTLEFVQNGVEMIGGFASADFGGVLVAAQIPKSAAFLAARDLMSQLLFVSLLLLVSVAVGGLFLSRRITRPVEHLSGATRQIAKGMFDIKVEVESRDEIGELAVSFNQMTSELKDRESALKHAQMQLIQSEKLAAFGQLGAGIAHEVKNPLAGILGCAQLSLMEVEQGTRLHKNVLLIEKETSRCKTIIENLLKFARQEKTAMEPIDVNGVVEDAVAIVNHQMELQDVKVRTQLAADLPLIQGSANQLQQVLMNLMMNGQQAMEGQQGAVTVTTRRTDAQHIEIAVSDTGPGIPEEIQSKLFEPFFTTKPTGKGTGLGLSVSFGIIKDHDAEITVKSELGQGATFIMTFPVLPPQVAAPVTELELVRA